MQVNYQIYIIMTSVGYLTENSLSFRVLCNIIIETLIERGGGTGPAKPQQRTLGTVLIPGALLEDEMNG